MFVVFVRGLVQFFLLLLATSASTCLQHSRNHIQVLISGPEFPVQHPMWSPCRRHHPKAEVSLVGGCGCGCCWQSICLPAMPPPVSHSLTFTLNPQVNKHRQRELRYPAHLLNYNRCVRGEKNRSRRRTCTRVGTIIAAIKLQILFTKSRNLPEPETLYRAGLK